MTFPRWPVQRTRPYGSGFMKISCSEPGLASRLAAGCWIYQKAPRRRFSSNVNLTMRREKERKMNPCRQTGANIIAITCYVVSQSYADCLEPLSTLSERLLRLIAATKGHSTISHLESKEARLASPCLTGPRPISITPPRVAIGLEHRPLGFEIEPI